jgi:transposase
LTHPCKQAIFPVIEESFFSFSKEYESMSSRKSLAMKNQILEMHQSQISFHAIARALHVSRNTVKRIVRENEKQKKPDEPEEETVSKSKEDNVQETFPWLAGVNLDDLLLKRKKGRTIKVLYEEYEFSVSYEHFRKVMRKLLIKKEGPAVTLKLQHKPGEQSFVDYAEGIPIYDRTTGEKRNTQFFCGVLPFSSLTFGEFTWDQKSESFISSHEQMWQYFGGVTPYVVSDNLKVGVQKAHLYDPDINPTFCEYANQRGFALMPARPRRPKDKAAVECAIGVLQRSFFQQVAEKKFYSLEELNFCFREFLDHFNMVIMKDYGVSRRDRFEEEKSLLKPLSGEAYEISLWKEVKVHPDCHVQIQKCFYSVPFSYVGQTLRARIRQKIIELFTSQGDVVAVHAKKIGRVGQYSTQDNHYPEHKVQQSRFGVQMAKTLAKNIGPQTSKMVDLVFSEPNPLKRLRFIQGVLRLVKVGRLTNEALEYACEQAMRFNKLRLSFITNCAKHISTQRQILPLKAPARDPEYTYLHSNYYH